MNDGQPQTQAVAVKDGKIAMVGARAAVEKAHKGSATQIIDLQGRTLMPGFFDSHSHVILTAIKNATVNLDPPPAGDVTSIEEMIGRLGQMLKSRKGDPNAWLIGWGYDHAMLKEGRHPTRDDLDKVSPDVPVLALHFSAPHMLVANSKALEVSGITASSKAPEGGIIQRRQGSKEPNGIVEETAGLPVLKALAKSLGATMDKAEETNIHPTPTVRPDDVLPQLIESALMHYASKGFTTAIEGGGTPEHIALLQRMADDGRLPIDVIGLVMYLATTPEKVGPLVSNIYKNRFRVAGGKVNLDGGTPGRTAFLRQPYFKQLPGEKDYRGYSSIAEAGATNNLIASYFAKDVPIFIHALGDAAVDRAIGALQYANRQHPGKGRRIQLIHLQQVQDDQFKALKDLDVTMTFQVTHNFFFADFHAKEILGPKRTSRLNPINTALKNGFSVTIHHDSPIHPVDQFMLIWATVNRASRSGKVWGPDERISVMDALKASTINAAYQFKEEKTKGSLEKGKLADMIIIDRNPLKIDPMKLKDLKVLETIKEGKSVFKAK